MKSPEEIKAINKYLDPKEKSYQQDYSLTKTDPTDDSDSREGVVESLEVDNDLIVTAPYLVNLEKEKSEDPLVFTDTLDVTGNHSPIVTRDLLDTTDSSLSPSDLSLEKLEIFDTIGKKHIEILQLEDEIDQISLDIENLHLEGEIDQISLDIENLHLEDSRLPLDIQVESLLEDNSFKDPNLSVEGLVIGDSEEASFTAAPIINGETKEKNPSINQKSLLNLKDFAAPGSSVSREILHIEGDDIEPFLERDRLYMENSKEGEIVVDKLDLGEKTDLDSLFISKLPEGNLTSEGSVQKDLLQVDSEFKPNLRTDKLEVSGSKVGSSVLEPLTVNETVINPSLESPKIIDSSVEGFIDLVELDLGDSVEGESTVIPLIQGDSIERPSNTLVKINKDINKVEGGSKKVIKPKVDTRKELPNIGVELRPDDNPSGNEEHDYIDPSELDNLPYDSVLGFDAYDSDDKHTKNLIDSIEKLNHLEPESSLVFPMNFPVDNGVFAEETLNSVRDRLTKDDQSSNIQGLALPPIPEEYMEKIKAAASTYLSGKKVSMADIEGFKESVDRINRIAENSINFRHKTPDYNLPSFSVETSLNLSSYIRFLAEKALPIRDNNPAGGVIDKSELRLKLLEEAIKGLILGRDKLEKLSGVNKERLPGEVGGWGLLGGLISNGVTQTAKDAVNKILTPRDEYLVKNPINRPDPSKETEEWVDANKLVLGAGNRADKSFMDRLKSKFNVVKNIKNLTGGSDGDKVIFKDKYLKGYGIATTIKDLCGADATSISSVEQLKDLLKNSEYITTSKKVTTSGSNSFMSTTLDSNSFWEVTLTPYVGKHNGYVSYLPAFWEINLQNERINNVITGYSKWVPISGFELQKSKMGSKSISLYDGEISIPSVLEFTNELRLTIVDDCFKSWKLYFEKCMEVSMYSSEYHDINYYKEKGSFVSVVDKKYPCVAPYKNVTFLCNIYIMTPQYSTLKKFSLLVVLKDIMEDFVGDIDSGGGELSVNFSIVGELGDDNDKVGTNSNKSPSVLLEEKSKNNNHLLANSPSGSSGVIR